MFVSKFSELVAVVVAAAAAVVVVVVAPFNPFCA